MLALLVCCGIQPLAHSSANNNLSTDYTVNVQSNTQARAQVCARETQPSAILGTSIGATCNDPLTASYYSCPTLCDVFIDHLRHQNDVLWFGQVIGWVVVVQGPQLGKLRLDALQRTRQHAAVVRARSMQALTLSALLDRCSQASAFSW